MTDLNIGIDVEKGSKDRKKHHHDHPCEFGRSVMVTVYQYYYHDQVEQRSQTQIMGCELSEPIENTKQEEELHHQEKQHDTEPAENHMYYALFPLFKQRNDFLLLCLFFHRIPPVDHPRWPDDIAFPLRFILSHRVQKA